MPGGKSGWREDGTEIMEADWFSYDRLPKIPGRMFSIARRLIDWFINKHQEQEGKKGLGGDGAGV